MERVRIKGRDGYNLDVHLFEILVPERVVQIIHGMEVLGKRMRPNKQLPHSRILGRL